jgi:O-antigen ligase
MPTIATVAGYPRITGTFSYMGSLSPYLRLNVLLGAAALIAGVRWKKTNLTVLGGLLVTISLIVIPMTGQRGLVVMVGIGVVILLLITQGRGTQRLGIVAVGVIVALIIGPGLQRTGLLEGWDALISRTERIGTEEAEGRIEGLLTAPFTSVDEAGLFGYGVGTNHQASPRFVQTDDWAGWLGVDNSVMRVMTELGALGWLVLTALKAFLQYLAFQAVRRSRNPIEYVGAATAFSVMLPHILLAVAFRPVSGAFYWGSAGIIIGIWSLQRVQHRFPGSSVFRRKTTRPVASS